MPSPMPGKIAVLATGGTIAGLADDAGRSPAYRAAQLGVAELVDTVPALSGIALIAEQVAQVDSKDMTHAIWHRLAGRVAHHLAQAEVDGIVVTHGSDTLEETAYFLHRVLAPAKPVVLTAAMRPANDPQADGPQNLLDAVRVAQSPGARGVLAVMNGTVHGATEVYKAHPRRIDAFSSGDAGPLGYVEAGRLRMLREWPADRALGAELPADVGQWPWVEIVASHAGAGGAVVRALQALHVRGIVAVATGNGGLHEDLQAALEQAQACGVRILLSSRCHGGLMVATGEKSLPMAPGLTPAKARIELMLALLRER